jgi:hypothetical protein
MTFARAVFAFALFMLVLGIVGSSYISRALFGDVQQSSTKVLGAVSTNTVAPAATATRVVSTPATTAASPTAVSTASTTVTPQALPTSAAAHADKATTTVHPAVRHPKVTAPTPRPTRALVPTSTPATGVVTLARYWVGSQRAHRGTTVAVGYVIDNGTGHTVRLLLGASIKGANSLSWATGTVNDPSHDVVAIVPPGVSTHIRYFTLPSRIHPGFYDAAWGLRNARNGSRTALVTASDALRVTR